MHANQAAATVHPQEDDLFEMANLYPRTTGLPVTVWVSPRGQARHGARVKLSTRPGDRMDLENTAVVAIRPGARLIEGDLATDHLRAVGRWIDLNQSCLLQYWDGEIDTAELMGRLRSV